MDYKKLITNRNTRLKILEALSFVPDSIMLKIQYRIKMGRRLNLDNPKRYTEKLQWYKIHYRNKNMIRCTDKADVRDYVREKGLDFILNECYGVFESSEQIDFSKLPDSFVLKDTLGSGGNSVILCSDKKNLDYDSLHKQLHEWVSADRKIKSGGREWPYYSGKQSRIIVEKILKTHDKEGLIDYKFFCFNGKVFCSYVLINDNGKLNEGQCGFFDREFNRLEASRKDYAPLTTKIEKPENYEQMMRYSEILSSDFPHARVDLYNVNEKIVFGELTFFTGSGYMQFEPDSFDFSLGEKFVLPPSNKDTVL